MNKKIRIFGAIAALMIIVSLMTTMAVLSVVRTQSNTVTIRGINLNVSPASIAWEDLEEGTASIQSQVVQLSNTANTPMAVTFSDDLATSGLSMTYPAPFVIPVGESRSVSISLNYDGSTTFGDYGWTVTATGTDSVATASTTLNAIADTMIHEQGATANYGTREWIVTGRSPDAGGKDVNSLIRFDLSALAGKTITSAQFKINVLQWQTANPVGKEMAVYPVTSAWTETGVTWATKPTSNPTASATATVPAGIPQIPGLDTVPPAPTSIYMTFDVKDLVQAWVSGTTNDGLLLKGLGFTSTGSEIDYASREGAITHGYTAPQLIIEYLSAS